MTLLQWMRKVAEKLDDAEFLRSFHKWATIWWATCGTVLSVIWANWLPWIVAMSLWANVASHWAAWQGTRAETNDNGSGSS